jgi:hypothetical protein
MKQEEINNYKKTSEYLKSFGKRKSSAFLSKKASSPARMSGAFEAIVRNLPQKKEVVRETVRDNKMSPMDIAEKLNTLESSLDSKVISNLPIVPTAKEIVDEIRSLKGNDRLDISNIRNGENLASAAQKINTLDQRWHGGGLSSVSHDATLTGNGTSSSPLSVVGGGGSGTVTSVSVASANGFAGTVATPATTPSITLSTSVTGLVKGNGTAISAAIANTDYQSPVALTTTGTSGVSTFDGTTLNIPQYAGTSYTLPTASTTVLGGVKIDGTSITISGGVISATTGGTGTVTSVTSADANATVATSTTTPVITVVSAPKLQTARNIAGVAFDGTANISLNNNAITNGAGYTTNTGTVTAVSVVTANGVSGSSSGGATPALTIALGAITPTSIGSATTATTQSPNDNSTKIATTAYTDAAVIAGTIGLLDYRGSYDASTNLFPSIGGSGIAGAVLKGDFWICSVSGTLGGVAVTPGDLIISVVDTPGQTSTNWDLIAHNLGSYVTNVTGTTNRVTSSGGATPSIDISASYVGQSSITTLGTVATGVWQGTAVGDTYISSASTWNAKAPTASPTFATSITGSYLTASQLLITDGSKNVISATTATYPSLTELAYAKGVTSAIQTQLNAKGTGTVSSGTAGTFAVYTGTGTTVGPTSGSSYAASILLGTLSLGSAADGQGALSLFNNSGTGTTTVQGNGSTTSTRVVTLPDATDTLVGRATTDTLTNKSIVASQITTGTFGTGAYTMDTRLTVPQILNADNAIAASANAATVTRANRNNVVTNNSAAGLTITLSTTSAAAGDMILVQSLPSSAVAQAITWVNTEVSGVTPSANLNASTTSPRTDGFKWNPLTSKWRCIASA